MSAIITATAIAAYHYITVENEIKEVDSQALQSNSDLNHTLLQKIQQLENSFTAKIHELEVAHSAELTEMREALNATEERLVNATIMIQDLEEKHLTVFREMERALDETEGKLEEATATLLMLEDSYFMTIAAIQRDVNVTKVKLDDTTGKIAELEEGLSGTETAITSLNVNKASKATVDGLAVRLGDLEIGKVDRTQFEVLSGNVTSLRETTSAADKDIRQQLSDTVRTSEFQETVGSIYNTSVATYALVEGVQGRVDTLALTKANQSDLEDLVLNIGDLRNTTKADQQEIDYLTASFESLSNNVILLREWTIREDAILHLELEALANGSLNLSHHIELQDLIAKFASTKANKTDLEALALDVTTLAGNTVRTSDFNQLSGTVDGIGHSIEVVSQLTLNLTTSVGHINSVLISKADQRNVDVLEARVTLLENTTAETEKLVASLKTSKEELNQLKDRVSLLNETTANEGQLQQDLEEKLANHTASSVETHSQLSLNISSNVEEIVINGEKLRNLRKEINRLKSSGRPGPVPVTWLIIMAASITLIFFANV